jgi:dihydrofolate reductase
MGKVVVLISTTPDGFAGAEQVIIDPHFFKFTLGLMAQASVAAFGRHTFGLFQSRWQQRLLDAETPPWVKEMAQALHQLPKVVFSTTLQQTTWHNSNIVPSLSPQYIQNFKRITAATSSPSAA